MEQATDLHNAFRRYYQSWIKNAPPQYQLNRFTQCVPIFLSIRFGQDVIIQTSDQAAINNAATMWNFERDYDNIALFYIAIATELT